MNKVKIMDKVYEMIMADQQWLGGEALRLLESGGVDPSTYEDNYRLPKILYSAALKNLIFQRQPINDEDRATAKNLKHF